MTVPTYLNGEFMPLQAARISPLDRGFLFADGVYEVIPVYQGRPFRLVEHLDRLGRSLAAIRLDDRDHGWTGVVNELVRLHGQGDATVYLQVTRGAPPGREHAFPPPGVTPTRFATIRPRAGIAAPAQERGLAAITLPDNRWGRCDIKSVALLANVLARQSAVDADADEAILVRDGVVTEGSASNVFAVCGGVLLTAPADHRILAGITRALTLELAALAAIPWQEKAVQESELAMAEEIWLTSTSREISPVTRLNGVPVGSGRPGPLWQRLQSLFEQARLGS